MLRRLIEFALTQRAFIGLATLILIAAGIYAGLRLPIDAFPSIAPVQAKIIMKARA